MLRQWLRASLQATRRAVAWNLKDVSPPEEAFLFNFALPEDVKQWDVYLDAQHGGIFSGSLSADVVDKEFIALKRITGFVGMQTIDDRRRIDLEPFQALVFRVKGARRCYISSLWTESWIIGPGDGAFNTWQSFLFAPKDKCSTVEVLSETGLDILGTHVSWSCRSRSVGLKIMPSRRDMGESLTAFQFSTCAQIPLSRYLPTWRGKMLPIDYEMNLRSVTGIGLSMTLEGLEEAVKGPGDIIQSDITVFVRGMWGL